MATREKVQQKSILVIDDDPDLALGLAVRLRAAGYDVSAAPDAITGFAKVRNEEPDLVLLDLGLPGGDGLTVLECNRSPRRFPVAPLSDAFSNTLVRWSWLR